jgi:hypothetical protein
MKTQSTDDKNNENFLSNLDFTQIEENDPSLCEGHKLLFDREVPFELRVGDESTGPQEVAYFESIRAKVLVVGEETCPSQVRIELSCENDLFFHFTHE